ncbi:Invertase/pectin methylesterase inhibitor domain superfamily [Arabidopsis suecica]|uniref:Invertase/pectin methylesterase inhibitor domain superfamily n=1 Tax=Arabidopsis suecica TaxID=45249 RepID=A0A8T1XRR2_ARASU|nr:Invertase/pectin methylesterase inhibitor domain superfamily [Arabidopsis suecica]
MASSSYCFGLVLSLAVLLPFLLISASATNYIDAICQRVTDKAFCAKTLNAYPAAASATSQFQAAVATLNLAISYADKCAGFSGNAAKENPNLKTQFAASQDAFVTISKSVKSAASELKVSPDTANYDVMVCSDSIAVVKNSVGKNLDNASKTVMTMTLMMEKLLAIAVGATVAVGG